VEEAKLSETERNALLVGYKPDVMSAEEKTLLYGAQSKVNNAVILVSHRRQAL
jgi:hypothetical protein